MHQYKDIVEKMDHIVPRDLYLIIAHLQGKLTFENVVMASHSNPEYVKRQIALATDVALMFYDNEKEMNDIMSGAE